MKIQYSEGQKKKDESVINEPFCLSLPVQPWLQEGLTAKAAYMEGKSDFEFSTKDPSKRPSPCPKLWRHECVSANAWRIRSFTRQTSFPSMEASFFAGTDSVEMQMLMSCPDLMEPFILSMHHDAVTRPTTLQCQPDIQLSKGLKKHGIALAHLHAV